MEIQILSFFEIFYEIFFDFFILIFKFFCFWPYYFPAKKRNFNPIYIFTAVWLVLFTAWHPSPFFVPNWPLKAKHLGNALAKTLSLKGKKTHIWQLSKTNFFPYSYRRPKIMGTEDVSYQQKFVAFEVDFILLFRLGIFNSTLLNDTHEGYWDQCGTYCFNVCSVTIYNFLRSSTCWVHGWQIGKKITIF